MKKVLLAGLVAFGLMVSPAVMAAEEAPKEVAGATTVDTDKVLEMIEDTEGLVIIDARKDADRATGWIEDSIHIVNTNVTPETLAEAIPAKDTPVIFYCNGPKCGRSSNATGKAVEAGYTNLYYYFGGMAHWTEAGLPLVKE